MRDGIFICEAFEKLIWGRFRDINFLTDENNAKINIMDLRSPPPPNPPEISTCHQKSATCNTKLLSQTGKM